MRATHDVDLLVSLADADTGTLMHRLTTAGFRAKRDPPVVPLGSVRVLQLLYQPGGAFMELQVDVLLAESEYHRHALTRRVPVHLPDMPIEVYVLTCEDLILHKLLAGRIVDRADCIALIVANRTAIDREYLARWSNQLGVTRELATVWGEALPGEQISES